MIIVVSVLLFFLLTLLNLRVKDKITRNMMYAFYAFWGISLLLSCFNPYGLHQVSLSTYILLLIFLICFTFGVVTAPTVGIKYRQQSYNYGYYLNLITSNRFVLFVVILLDCFLINIYVMKQAILESHTVLELRTDLDELLYQGNSFLGLTNNLIVQPLTPIINLCAAYLLVYNRKKIIPTIIFAIFITLSALISGSRGGFISLVSYVFFVIICKSMFSGNVKVLSNKNILYFIIFVLVVLIVIANMTAQRLYNIHEFSFQTILLGVEDLSKHFVTYLVGPFRALDYALENNYLEIVGGYQYGRCTFGFVDTMLQLVLNNLGINYEAGVKSLASYLQNNWIDIGNNNSFNFAYTAILFFYIDFGLLGVFMFPFVLGYVSRMIVNKLYTKNNPFIMVLCAYLFTILYGTGFTWRLYRYNSLVTIVFIIFLYVWFERKYKYLK